MKSYVPYGPFLIFGAVWGIVVGSLSVAMSSPAQSRAVRCALWDHPVERRVGPWYGSRSHGMPVVGWTPRGMIPLSRASS